MNVPVPFVSSEEFRGVDDGSIPVEDVGTSNKSLASSIKPVAECAEEGGAATYVCAAAFSVTF